MTRNMRVEEDGRTAVRSISPTDVSQFLRLDQCQRYLRLRLRERAEGNRFLTDYGVAPQSIPPLLTRSGAAFERAVEDAIAARFPTVACSAEGRKAARCDDDNELVIERARALQPGQVLVLFQPRLQVEIGGWRLRGDVDVLRLEREGAGDLRPLIADIKSSTATKVEHRLQVAFYHEMLAALFASAGEECAAIDLAILYRGPAGASDETKATEREAAERLFGVTDGLLEQVEDADAYLGAVHDLVTGSRSVAERVTEADLATLPFHLTYKCDGCLYNQFCMKWSAEHDDLSLLPHLTEQDKSAFQGAGIDTVSELVTLMDFDEASKELTPAAGREPLAQELAATWPVGPRLDELIHRARRYRRFKGDDLKTLSYIPSKGYGSLPYSDAGHNPNLVRVYVDAQHDYLHDRVYLLGSLVVASEDGEPRPERRQSIVHLADGPPDATETEEGLFVRWVTDTLRAIVEVAAPDEEGQSRAPIHLIFFNRFDQRVLLEGLGRHMGTVLGATPLYDFVTQLAAFDSPIATFLDQEIRELKNYPMVCQSLQAVAGYLKFDWNEPEPYRDLFRARLFDFWGKFDEPVRPEESPWYTSRARFNSQIPLEFAYAAWGELSPSPARGWDELAPYRKATPALLAGFQARRLEAMEHVAGDFKGNQQTEKRVFDLPSLDAFDESPRGLAQALDEFVTIERHVELGAWKAARLPAPERRVLAGETLIVSYHEDDQDPDVAVRNRDNERRWQLRQDYVAAFRVANPGAEKVKLSKEEKAESDWSQDGLVARLRVELENVGCCLDEALGLTTLREGEMVVVCPRWVEDSRLPVAERVPLTPTPKRMLYGMRAVIEKITVDRDGDERAVAASVELRMRTAHGGPWSRGFVFGSLGDRPFADGTSYTIDPDPNNWYGYWCKKVTEGLVAGEPNTLYARLEDATAAHMTWPDEAVAGQARFLSGLDRLHQAGVLHDFESSKRDFIGAHGTDPTLLVQGPPGTGKSYSTAFALFARLQGAMAAGRDYRVVISCKTHAATDVLLQNIAEGQATLRQLYDQHSDILSGAFDPRLLDVLLFRLRPRNAVPPGVVPLYRKEDRGPDDPDPVKAMTGVPWSVTAAPPGGIYGMLNERKKLFGRDLIDCLVLDEASQMNLPEAAMAALPLKPDGHLIVVGDHRQMPPIVKHDWAGEPRRTFREYRAFESLFAALLERNPPLIQFEESFRLHTAMAEFLRREIYHQDGIDYHSRRQELLDARSHPDPFVTAVLDPRHPLVVIVHDERRSQLRNPFEQALIAPVLDALADPDQYGLDPLEGMGVVVPHRAQRAALQQAVPSLTVVDARTGAARSAVDTVERFQGGERTAIVISATESDPAYLLVAGEFLLDPRRLTVALSRAKRKLILVASQSVFAVISPDEETFAKAQLWKNLLRRTCTVKLWEGERHEHHVEVWGNDPNAVLNGKEG